MRNDCKTRGINAAGAYNKVMNYPRKTRPKSPSKAAIVEANRDVWRGLCFDTGLYEKAGPEHQCWACGGSHVALEKAHIHAHHLGGSGANPRNFFLLCIICHREQPDTASREEQVYWLRNHETSFERVMRKAQPFTDAVLAGLITEEESHRLIMAGLPPPRAA